MQRVRAKNVQSPDLYQTKVTPRSRPVHEAMHDGKLINPDPQKKYCLVPKSDEHPMNYQYYQSLGYEVEIAAPKGVRIHMGSPAKDGSPLCMRELVLMSCSIENAQKLFESGPNGMTGQKYYDNLMSRIRRDPTNKKSNEIIPGLREQYDISDPDNGIEDNTFR